MKKYRISGFQEETGPCQVDVSADNESQAKEIAFSDHDFYSVHSIDELI